jgi:ribulose-5-phosphate 4-epimerase/fuculose-1-phosphate aldolase
MSDNLVFERSGQARGALVDWLVASLESAGRVRADNGGQPSNDGQSSVVLHLVDPEAPRPCRRRSRAIFVVGLGQLGERPVDVLTVGYPLLVRSLSNLFILLVPAGNGGRRPDAYFITLERGYYPVRHDGDDQAFLSAVLARLEPLATSRLVIDNEFQPDLPPPLWSGDEQTEAIYRAGRRLKALDLLPAPFPIEQLLPARDYRHVQRLFGIGGLSYGNISVRHDRDRFWMTASGVDKSELRTVGQEILLVTGFDSSRGVITLSVPPDRPPRRVSVDAIEHLMIYREHPGVGAIVHVHAWMDGVMSTDVNYPCGTLELAQEVSGLVRRAPDPTRAVVGLRNHGLTITGPDLEEIFDRIEGRILRQVPMT